MNQKDPAMDFELMTWIRTHRSALEARAKRAEVTLGLNQDPGSSARIQAVMDKAVAVSAHVTLTAVLTALRKEDYSQLEELLDRLTLDS